MAERQEKAECQGVVTKDGGHAKLQGQYAKRRKPGKKLLERILNGWIRKRVEQELGEDKRGIKDGRGTTEWMFALSHMVEKRLEI